MKENFLFIYGSLLTPSNPFGAYLMENSTLWSKGCIKGTLYDTGDYPAAIYDPASPNLVHGSIYELGPNRHDIFKVLDEYEGFNEDHLESSEFIRCECEVLAGNEVKICWTYVYNRSYVHLPAIPSGDYILYKKG